MIRISFSFSIISFILLILTLFTISTHAQSDEQGDRELLRKCLAADDCGSCAELDDCGWCGVVGRGVCVPGDSSGSALDQYGRKECPSKLWRYEDSSCDVSYRKVTKTLSDSTATFSSISLNNQDGDFSASFASFVLSTVGRPTILMGHGSASENEADISFTGAMFESMLEYPDGEQNGLSVDNKELIEKRTPLDDFNPISVSTQSDGDLEMYKAITNTTDGVFGVQCVLSNGPYQYEGQTSSPYEMKCDISIKGYAFESPQNRIALAAALVSSTIEAENDEELEIKFGGGNFLTWSDKYSRSSSSEENSGNVLISENVLNDPFEGSRAVAKFCTFSFVGEEQGNIFWDPRVGVDPVEAETGEDLQQFRQENLGDSSGAAGVTISILSYCSLLVLVLSLYL